MSASKQVSVGVTPTLLYQADGPDPETVLLMAAAAGVTIGGPNVVAGQGITCPTANPPLQMVVYEDSVYGIVASGTVNVNVAAFLASSR